MATSIYTVFPFAIIKLTSQTKKKKLIKEEEKRMSEEIELQTLLTKLLIDDLEKYLNYSPITK